MNSLPTKLRVDIRDKFDAKEAPLRKAFEALEETLGYGVRCNPEWNILWAALSESFPDKGTFVPCLARILTQWCEALGSRLEDDKFKDWTEEFLEKVQATGANPALVLELQIGTKDQERPSTSWSAQYPSTFVVRLPEKAFSASHMTATGFETDFIGIFEPAKKGNVKGSSATKDYGRKDDDWATVDETGEEVQSIRISEGSFPTHTQTVEVMPTVDMLSRPEILFETLLPYILTVRVDSSNKIRIESTHQPSLMLLASYFKKWTKQDHNNVNKIPKVKIELAQSHFGLGQSYDGVIIEPFDDRSQRWTQLNSVLIRGFIEGVLGYRLMHDNGDILTYNRDTRFK